MDSAQRHCVTIVERSYPPNRSITGESACDLAEFLIAEYDIDVHIVHLDSEYQGGNDARKPVGTQHILSSSYNGKKKIRRLLSSLSEGKSLISKAIEMNKGPIICMTNPPLLNFWAARLIPSDRKWMLWSMDLFPDAFVSGNLVKPNNFMYKYLYSQTYRKAPNHLIALGDVQAAAIHQRYKQDIPTTVLPCGIMLSQNGDTTQDDVPAWKSKHQDKIIFGYCGNLGEAHSPEFLKYCIDNINPTKHHLILVAYGVHGDDILTYANEKLGISILKSVPRHHLQYLDINLVSLKEHWVNVCVPSKLVSAVFMGSAFLFCGIEQCDNWQMMQDAGWLIPDDANMSTAVSRFFTTIDRSQIKLKKEKAKSISQELVQHQKMAYHAIANAIINLQ